MYDNYKCFNDDNYRWDCNCIGTIFVTKLYEICYYYHRVYVPPTSDSISFFFFLEHFSS